MKRNKSVRASGGYDVKIILEGKIVVRRVDAAVDDIVFCKHTNREGNVVRNVVTKHDKRNRSKNGCLRLTGSNQTVFRQDFIHVLVAIGNEGLDSARNTRGKVKARKCNHYTGTGNCIKSFNEIEENYI